MAQNLAHGFAAMNGGTTGGSGGASVTVTTGAQLQAAINSVTSSSEPLTIYVDGKITAQNSGVDVISIAGRNNISIIGKGAGAEFDGIGIRVSDGSSNLIIQNLKIHNVDTGPKDAIGIEGPSKNIWIDHNELYSSLNVDKDYYDGLLDIKRGAEYITVSNNYLHDHHKASLVGYSDEDVGARYVTYDHNVFDNLGSRAPSVRFGYAHIYDNYYTNISTSGINLRMGAVGLIENNVFENVRDPIASLDSAKPGYWDLRGNVLTNVTWGKPGANEATAQSGRSTASYNVPYTYQLDAASTVKAYDLAHAGVGHLTSGGSAPSQPLPGTGSDETGGEPNPTQPSPTQPSSGRATEHSDVLGGSAGKDSIAGLAGADQIHGNAGDDTLDGGDGRDVLYGDAGNDTLTGGNGNDQLDGGAGNDRLIGGNGSDVLDGGAGDDVLEGGASVDVLRGGAGNDRLDGGTNGDTMSGGAGNDTYVVDSARDSVIELTGEGTDTVESSVTYRLGDNVENLTLTGSSATSAYGNALDNVLIGNAGANRIDGGAGDDVLSGGGGRDIFSFAAGAGGYDVIRDFILGEDSLQLDGFKAADAVLTDTQAGSVLHLPSETILLQGVHVPNLSADWARFG